MGWKLPKGWKTWPCSILIKELSFISEDEDKAAVYEDEFELKAFIKDLNKNS